MGSIELGRDQSHNPIIITYDDQLSFRDFTGWSMKDHAELSFNGKTIYGSCFSNEKPDSQIFPVTMRNATFAKCNLDNIILPATNTAIQCSQRRFKAQNDLRDWEIDVSNNPVRVINEKYWISRRFSVDPNDIPAQRLNSLDEITRTG